MPIPLNDSDNIASLADQAHSRLKSAYRAALSSQAQVSNDIWNQLINIPSEAKALQEIVDTVQSSVHTAKIISSLSTKLPNSVVASDLLSFKNAFDDLASTVEANISEFVVTINPTSKRSEFVTPINQSIKTTIQNKINAVLSEVN